MIMIHILVKQSGASPTQPPPISHEQQQDRAHGTDNQPLVDKNKPEKQSMGATNGGTNGKYSMVNS